MKDFVYSLGIHTSHDASACLMRNNEIIVAIEKERLTRSKHEWGSIGLYDIVNYCLDYAKISLEDIDIIVVCDIDNVFNKLVFSKKEIRITHHLAHAWASVLITGQTDTAVLIIDGEGSKVKELDDNERQVCNHNIDFFAEKESCYYFSKGIMRPIRKWTSGRGSDSFFSGTDSIGSPYWFLSQLMFAKEHQESKVMGLASYGKQKERFSNIYSYKDLGEVEISNQWIFDLNDIPKNDLMNNFDLYADIAYTIQNQFEYAITHKANWLFEQVKSENLIFSGGVALNCVANSYLYHNSIFKNIYVPFGAGDSSISIGCAYYGISVLLGDDFKPNETISSPYLGKEYTKNEISRAIDKFKHFIEYENKYTLKKIAEFINQNKLIAFVHGRSEFGPRALGNRSLLASPKNPEARNLINSKVKYRESYRPFAPVVLFEFAAEYFDDIVPNSYHMQFIATVKEAKRHLLPAITHVDNTARIQLLKREHNKDLYDLIVEFYKISGVPILLNTSFNW